MESELTPFPVASSWVSRGALMLISLLVRSALIVDAAASVLTGTVKNADGELVSGARVFIFAAAPMEGVSTLCPSCYEDCRKWAVSDGRGRFIIEGLDPMLLFRVLVVANEYQPKFVTKVDPSAKALRVTLRPEAEGDTPDTRVRGRVVNAEGKPVSGAVINIRGVSRGDSTRFGGNSDIDSMAVTDALGMFTLHGQAPFDAVGVDIEARGLAKGIFERLSTGDMVHELKLTEGVSVQGRLVRDGKPLPGVEVGISGADRSSQVFVGHYSVATDGDGRFLFVNLPRRTDYLLYGMMKSLRGLGSVPSRHVRTQEDGSTLEAGDLKVERGFIVEGQVRLADQGPIPAKTRVVLSREEAWDSQQVDIDPQGRFRVESVPPEIVTVSARISGYRLSLRNASLDPLNPFYLIGRVGADKTDLIIELESGQSHDRLEDNSSAVREEPLRGAEALKDRSGDIQVTGTVVDAENGKPLRTFTVTEGRIDPYRSDFNWFSRRKTTHTNGAFEVYLTTQRQLPGVLIEADGYLPHSSGGLATSRTNLAISLKKGRGPAGVLVKPDGQPTADVTVYLTDMRNGVYVSGEKLEVRENAYRGTRSTRSDQAGRFSFAPQMEAFAVIVVSDAGYGEVRVEELARQPEVRLQSWARVEGQLKIGARAGANESVRLWPAHLPYQYHPRGFPPLGLYLNTTTDNEGRFVFERVPPIAVEVYHEPKVRDSRTGATAMSQTTKFTLKPGETRQLTLGGKGRAVIGRLTVNGYRGKINWRADVHSLELIVPEPPELPGFKASSTQFNEAMRTAKSDAEKSAARADYEKKMAEKQQAFYATDAGRQYHFAKCRYALNFSQDGSFRIEDVPSGKYSLRIDLREGEGDSPSRFSAPRIAELNKEIQVPESPEDHHDEPLDLGNIELVARAVQ